MNWVRKQKLPAIEALCFNSQLCIELDKLWQALYQPFNSAQDYQINIEVLDKILSNFVETPQICC